jgi:hypothetical protein
MDCLGSDHVVIQESYDVITEMFSVRWSVPRLYNASPLVANLNYRDYRMRVCLHLGD